ncbi:unnamed protein product, partial [Prorocentrum cordatum]
AFMLQPKRKRLSARQFFKAQRHFEGVPVCRHHIPPGDDGQESRGTIEARTFIRATVCSSLTVAVSLAIGQLLVGAVVKQRGFAEPVVKVFMALFCMREFRILSLLGAVFGVLKLEM